MDKEMKFKDITPEDSIVPIYLTPLSAEEQAEREAWAAEEPARQRKLVEDQRRAAYQTQSDPLFFGWQRGDNTEQEWLDAVQAVKDAHPYPEGEATA